MSNLSPACHQPVAPKGYHLIREAAVLAGYSRVHVNRLITSGVIEAKTMKNMGIASYIIDDANLQRMIDHRKVARPGRPALNYTCKVCGRAMDFDGLCEKCYAKKAKGAAM